MKYIYILLMVVTFGCKEKYEPPIEAPELGYLVIEGYITPNGVSQLHLTRTIPLADSARLLNERLADVRIEGNDGSKLTLPETGTGVYTHNNLNLNSSRQYRLFIKTRDGKEYASDFAPVRPAPAIDSVHWKQDDTGLWIYVDTHDPQNNTRFYRWETEETWEFHSLVGSELMHDRNPVSGEIIGVKYRKPDHSIDSSIYTCWQHEYSKDLILGSTEKLSEDKIRTPLIFIPKNTWKLSVLYSLNVKQYALTKPEYEFLHIMKRNSEETGSVFDPQPSQLKNNIHCLSNPNDPVVGYFSIAPMREVRIFIKNKDVTNWNFSLLCTTDTIAVSQAKNFPNMAPIAYWTPGIFMAGTIECIECTSRGTNVKPSFWP